MITKPCKECKQILPLESFGKDSGANYLRYECKNCAKERGRITNELKKIVPPAPADHKCPICDRNEEQIKNSTNSKRSPWCLDHDHKTGKFRGWLCQKCNLGTGNFDDDVTRLKNAIVYLESVEQSDEKEKNSIQSITSQLGITWQISTDS